MTVRLQLRRVLKLLLVAVGVFIVLVLAVAVFLRIKYPPEKLKALALQEASKALKGRRVTLGEVSLSPFRGFSLKEFAVADSASGIDVARVEELAMNYRLSSLLRKRLVIHRILVDAPWVRVVVDKEGRTNLDDLIAAPKDTLEEAPKDTAAVELPLVIELGRLDVRNVGAEVRIETDSSWQTASIEGLYLQVKDIRFKSLDDLGGNLRLSTKAGRWRFKEEDEQKTLMEVGSALDLQLRVPDINLHRLVAEAAIGLSSFHIHREDVKRELPDAVQIQADLAVDLDRNILQIEGVHVAIAEWLSLDGKGFVEKLNDVPVMDLALDSLNVDLGRLVRRARETGLVEFPPELNGLELEADASLQHVYVKGALDGRLEWTASFGFEATRLSVPGQGLVGDGIHFQSSATGTYEGTTGSAHPRVSAQLDIAGISYVLPDTSQGTVQDMRVELSAEARWDSVKGLVPEQADVKLQVGQVAYRVGEPLTVELGDLGVAVRPIFSEYLLPDEVAVDLSIGHVLDGHINGTFLARSQKPDLEHPIPEDIQGRITATHLRVDSLADSAVTGSYSLSFDLNAHTLDDVLVSLQVQSEDAAYLLNGVYESLPLYVRMESQLGISEDFADVAIHRFDLNALDMLTVTGFGEMLKYGQERVSVTIEKLQLDNARALAFVPDTLLSEMGPLALTGTTTLSATLEGVLRPEAPLADYRARTTICLRDINAAYPQQYLSVSGLNTEIEIEADPDTVVAHATVIVDSVQKGDVLDEPLLDTKVVLNALMLKQMESDSVLDYRARFGVEAELPSFEVRVQTNGEIDRMLNAPAILATAELRFSSADSVRLPQDMWAMGDMDVNVSAKLESTDRAEISGIVALDSLCIGIAPLLAVEGISGHIPFMQRVDLEHRTLLSAAHLGESREPWLENIAYSLWRPYYTRDGQTASRFHVRRIKVLDYEVSDLDMDVHYRDSVLDIQRFVLSAYDGNMAGYGWVDLGTGDPEEITYQIKAQLAGINSAKLSRARERRKEASEICANLEFTGRGVDLKRKFDIEGHLHITKIERWVADNLLVLMDPKETDKSIQNVRRLMRQGWGVKSFSFVMKHGFIYPSIVPAKPWYAPFSLPKSLDFPRMPLKFFLQLPTSPQGAEAL